MPFPLLPAIIAGVGALGGGIAGAIGDAAAAGDANRTNKEIAEKATAANQASAREQMAFQERMSNTAYQRGIEDMRKAGLNPMLAFSQGGASAPAGTSSTAATTRVDPVPSIGAGAVKGISGGLASALNVAQAAQSLEQTDANIKLAEMSAQAKAAEAASSVQSAKNASILNQKMALEIPAYRSEARARESQAEIDKSFQTYDAWTSRIFEALGGISSLPGKVMRGFGGGKSDGKMTRDQFMRQERKAFERRTKKGTY